MWVWCCLSNGSPVAGDRLGYHHHSEQRVTALSLRGFARGSKDLVRPLAQQTAQSVDPGAHRGVICSLAASPVARVRGLALVSLGTQFWASLIPSLSAVWIACSR